MCVGRGWRGGGGGGGGFGGLMALKGLAAETVVKPPFCPGLGPKAHPTCVGMKGIGKAEIAASLIVFRF